MGERVFVDANVLFSRTLRDWVFLLKYHSHGQMFTLGSTEDVLAETFSRLRDKHPNLPGAVITRLRERIVTNLDEMIDDFIVEPWMTHGDAGDAHVRAAANAGGFGMLLTDDVGLLSERESVTGALYEPISPDDFLVLIDDSNATLVRRVTQIQLHYFMGRHGNADLTGHLRAAGCLNFAERINLHCHALLN